MIISPERRGTDSLKWGIYGEGVLPLWVADMDFASPPEVIEALQKRVQHGVFGYALESRELKSVIAARMQERYDWRVSSKDILLLPGVVSAFNLVCQAIAAPGESVLIQPPVYPPFFMAPGTAKASIVTNDLVLNDGVYEVNFDSFNTAIREDTRCFLFCNPHNPVGKVYSRVELSTLAEICIKKDIIICSDEIHSDLVYPGKQHIPIASLDKEIEERTVTLIAPSKTFNIAGLECSALICSNPEIMDKINQTRRGLLGGVNLLGQTAALAAYKFGAGWLKDVMTVLEGNRNYLLKYLKDKLPEISMVKPDATYLAWLDCRKLTNPMEPRRFFLENAKVALNPGLDFGKVGEGFVRLNFGCSKATLTEALDRMANALGK